MIFIELNQIYNEDCLEGMKSIKDKSIDMILCDLPYTTSKRKTTWNGWDNEINLEKLWSEYNRIIKDNGAIVLFAIDPFGSGLIQSNFKNYKYKWIWKKENSTGFLNAKRQPLRIFEEILVFYKKQCTYNPQMTEGKPYIITKGATTTNYCSTDKIVTTINKGERYPTNVLEFNRDAGFHPTQKPVALCEYLIKTYTNEGELVLDNTVGSGTTAIACINTKRNYIGFELDENYFSVAQKRINDHKSQIT